MYSNKGKKKNYAQLNLQDFSDDESDDGRRHQSDFRDEYDETGNEASDYIRNQQVRKAGGCVSNRMSRPSMLGFGDFKI